MLRITFSDHDIEQLRHERYHHPHPRVQQKMEALLLKSQGLPHHTIIQCMNICENTLLAYLRAYQEGGIEALKQLNFYRPASELAIHHDRQPLTVRTVHGIEGLVRIDHQTHGVFQGCVGAVLDGGEAGMAVLVVDLGGEVLGHARHAA